MLRSPRSVFDAIMTQFASNAMCYIISIKVITIASNDAIGAIREQSNETRLETRPTYA